MVMANGFFFALKLALLLILFVSVNTKAQSPLSFDLAPSYLTGVDTADVEYGDIDGDGNIDIAVVNIATQTPTISILYGTAQGGFGAPVIIPSNLIPHTLAIGDLNHDGRPEIVVGAFYQNRVGVFLNLGNRQFAPPVISFPPDPPIPNAAEFYEMAIGDFNCDGTNEVVAVQDQSGKRLRFFEYSADGVLTVFHTLAQPGPGTENSLEGRMEVGYLNADSCQDIVFTGGGPADRSISFIYGQSNGNLAFTDGFYILDEALGLEIVDIDNDNDKDLLVGFAGSSNPNQPYVRTFLNNGVGVFTASPKFNVSQHYDLAAGDFNNDGKLDAAVLLTYGLVMVLNGNGDGTFGGEKFYSTSLASRIMSADLNHDQKPDLFMASVRYTNYNQLTVLMNDDFDGFKSPRVVPGGGFFGNSADFNGDGFRDLVSSWQTFFVWQSSIDILMSDTAGWVLPETNYATPVGLQEMGVGDFNGDGAPDVVSAHVGASLTVYLNSNGQLGTGITTSFNASVRGIVVGDFNADGKDDVYATSESARGFSMLSNGNGTFAIAPGFPVNLPANVPFQLQKGDFNGDGKLDLVISMNSDVQIWIGDGQGGFVLSSAVIPPIESAVPCDLNGDGNLDLAGWTPVGIIGVIGNGNGSFTNSFSLPVVDTLRRRSNICADFDFDGFDDIAFITPEGQFGDVAIVPSGGTVPSWKQPVHLRGANISQVIIAADFNNDRKLDLGYIGGASRGVIYNQTPGAVINPWLDFDGDKKTDISVFRPTVGEWWINRSSSGQTSASQFGDPSDKPTPGDFTGDGRADVAFFRPGSGEWFVLRSEDGTYLSFPFGTVGDVPVPFDFDGDGKVDVGVFRPSTNQWFIQKSRGGITIRTFGAEGDRPAVADYDGDGKADIAVFRPADGSWWYVKSSDNQFRVLTFGNSTDKPVPADYTGDGKSDIAVFRPATGEWFIQRSEDNSYFSFPFGSEGDLPVPGDYDGDGKFDAGIFRPTAGLWFVNRTTAGLLVAAFGTNGDRPLPNVFTP